VAIKYSTAQRVKNKMTNKKNPLIELVKGLLIEIGEDPARDGLLETPERFIKAFKEMTVGYKEDPKKILNKTFKVPYDEIVLLKDIGFTSLCEHHLLPFFGSASIVYLPNKVVVGISKIARLVKCFSKRLQVQERLTMQIADTMEAVLKPRGVAVIITATHQCMECRGIETRGTKMITSVMRGKFRRCASLRNEVLQLIT